MIYGVKKEAVTGLNRVSANLRHGTWAHSAKWLATTFEISMKMKELEAFVAIFPTTP